MNGPPQADPTVRAFWEEAAAATGVEGPWTAWAFGGEDTPQLATELAALVLDGAKRATTGLLAEYEEEGEPLPAPGDVSVVLDGAGAPVCVIRTTEVTVAAFGDVDERFARDEGEGDRTLAWWRDAHLRFWRAEGRTVTDDSPVVLERFEVVWPSDG